MPYRNPLQDAKFSYNEKVPTVRAEVLERVQMGYGRIISGLLWLRFLQETPVEKVEPGHVSWAYFDLDTITRLDPDFVTVFSRGGSFISVITEDKWGAEQLLLRGVELHPKEWRIGAFLAYHYELELLQPEKAAYYFQKTALLPDAPLYVKLVAASKLSKTQGTAAAIKILEEMHSTAENETVKNRIETKLAELRRRLENEKRARK